MCDPEAEALRNYMIPLDLFSITTAGRIDKATPLSRIIDAGPTCDRNAVKMRNQLILL